LLYLMAILCHINHGVLPRLRLLGSAITAIYILYIFCCSQIFLQLQQVLKTGNSNWHLPVICIILRERLFHFGLGNDADRTCHAAGFCAALLIKTLKYTPKWNAPKIFTPTRTEFADFLEIAHSLWIILLCKYL